MMKVAKSVYLFIFFVENFWNGNCCNVAICARTVTKCQLLRHCNCDVKQPSCVKSCMQCLGKYHDECCNCVGVCPKDQQHNEKSNIVSEIERFSHPIPELFSALTQYPDIKKRWSSYEVPTSEDNKLNKLEDEAKCSVAFLQNCVPRKECVNICRSMGSSSSRWFTNGCCECIGPNCEEHGLKIGRCKKCSD